MVRSNSNRLRNSADGYLDPVVVELLFTSLMTMFWAPTMYVLCHSDPCSILTRTMHVYVLYRSAHAVHTRHEHKKRYLFSFLFEVAGLGIFFVFWLVGVAVATVSTQRQSLRLYHSYFRQQSYWGKLHYCHQYRACRLLTALVAFAWMGWIMILVLLVVSALFAFSNKAFHEPLHGRWDPRESHYRDSRGIFPQMRSSTA